MINLLPPELKGNYHYARRNIGLRRWILLCVIAFIGLAAVGTYGMLSLQQSTLSYQKQIADSKTLLQKEDLAGTQKKIQDISGNFKLVVKVLGQEVLFSKLLQQMSTVMPLGSELTGLTIQDTTGGLDISAKANNYYTATQVQVNLADPNNKIFTKADIVNISCKQGSDTDSRFPCTVQLRTLFGANNPYLFINSKGQAKS